MFPFLLSSNVCAEESLIIKKFNFVTPSKSVSEQVILRDDVLNLTPIDFFIIDSENNEDEAERLMNKVLRRGWKHLRKTDPYIMNLEARLKDVSEDLSHEAPFRKNIRKNEKKYYGLTFYEHVKFRGIRPRFEFGAKSKLGDLFYRYEVLKGDDIYYEHTLGNGYEFDAKFLSSEVSLAKNTSFGNFSYGLNFESLKSVLGYSIDVGCLQIRTSYAEENNEVDLKGVYVKKF